MGKEFTVSSLDEMCDLMCNNVIPQKHKKKKVGKDFYAELDKAIKSYEEFKLYHLLAIEQITDKIDWCWKFRKITEEQMEELAGRVVKILER